jgi:hypothetical protein
MTFRVEIHGIDRLLAKLDALQVAKVVKPHLTAAALDVMNWVSDYPPSTEANVPNALGRWYERGRGAMRRRKDGSVVVDRASQLLGRSMTEQVGGSWYNRTTNGGLGALVGTKATYARYVIDRDVQASFHARRGWRTVQAWIEGRGKDVVRNIERRIQQIIGGL